MATSVFVKSNHHLNAKFDLIASGGRNPVPFFLKKGYIPPGVDAAMRGKCAIDYAQYLAHDGRMGATGA